MFHPVIAIVLILKVTENKMVSNAITNTSVSDILTVLHDVYTGEDSDNSAEGQDSRSESWSCKMYVYMHVLLAHLHRSRCPSNS